MNYFSFHIGDYAVHTRYLSLMPIAVGDGLR